MTQNPRALLQVLASGRISRSDEQAIVDLLTKADAADLNEMLVDPQLTDRLMSTRAAVVLAVTRRAELDLVSRSTVIHGLQTGRTDRAAEALIAELLCEVHGEDLTVLKNLIDATPNHHDLSELVFEDIDDVAIRQSILDHIAEQAATLTGRESKVLSDIDDTTLSALHDRRFPRGTIYPGVIALWDALDLGIAAKPRSLGDLTFITARPADLIGFIENRTRDHLRSSGVGRSSVLSGSFMHLLTRSGMADKKIENIARYHLLYPEYRLVFIGDSGQGDVIVAQRLLAEFAGVVDACLIHDIVQTDAETRAEYADEDVIFFDTYVGAAVAAHAKGLITDAGLAGVVKATVAGFDQVDWKDEQQEQTSRELLEQDLLSVPAGTTLP